MRKTFTKAAVVLAGVAAATTIGMGAAQAEERFNVPDHATCEKQGMEKTNHKGPWMCSPNPDGTWTLEIG